jgi:hypothetical protein
MQALEEEAAVLRHLHAKIAEQLHRLQVEEVGLQRQVEVYRRNDYMSTQNKSSTPHDFNTFNEHLTLMNFEAQQSSPSENSL